MMSWCFLFFNSGGERVHGMGIMLQVQPKLESNSHWADMALR
jgi:hypothetical protein